MVLVSVNILMEWRGRTFRESAIFNNYSPHAQYSPIITEPEANNCFSINTQVIISKKRKKKTFQREIIFTYSGKTTTGSHFVRRGDYRLIIRGREPMRARDFV